MPVTGIISQREGGRSALFIKKKKTRIKINWDERAYYFCSYRGGRKKKGLHQKGGKTTPPKKKGGGKQKHKGRGPGIVY